MKHILVSALVFVTGFWGLSAFAHGHHRPDQHVIFSGEVHAHLFWEVGPALKEESILRIEFMNGADHTPLEIQAVPSVELWMPEMGHGSSPTTIERVVNEEGQTMVGAYRVSSIYFVMAGHWEVRLSLTDQSGSIETKTVDVNVSSDGSHGGHHHMVLAAQTSKGIVKFYNEKRGFGFVTPLGGVADRVFYAHGIDPQSLGLIQNGSCVSFDAVEGEDGTKIAENVRLIECDLN